MSGYIYRLEIKRVTEDCVKKPDYTIKEEGFCPYNEEDKLKIINDGLKSLRRFNEKCFNLEGRLVLSEGKINLKANIKIK